MKIRVKRLTGTSFAPFGRVVKTPSGKPTSQAPDYKFWSDIADYAIAGETEIGICMVFAQKKKQIASMERHKLTPEVLIPIDGPFILPLLLEGGRGPQAFRVDPGEAVVIEGAVWHGACLPVSKKQSSYFVIFRKNTPDEDVEKKTIEPFELVV